MRHLCDRTRIKGIHNSWPTLSRQKRRRTEREKVGGGVGECPKNIDFHLLRGSDEQARLLQFTSKPCLHDYKSQQNKGHRCSGEIQWALPVWRRLGLNGCDSPTRWSVGARKWVSLLLLAWRAQLWLRIQKEKLCSLNQSVELRAARPVVCYRHWCWMWHLLILRGLYV